MQNPKTPKQGQSGPTAPENLRGRAKERVENSRKALYVFSVRLTEAEWQELEALKAAYTGDKTKFRYRIYREGLVKMRTYQRKKEQKTQAPS